MGRSVSRPRLPAGRHGDEEGPMSRCPGVVSGFAMVLALTAGLAQARATPGQKCAAAKNSAAAKKISSKLRCQQRALLTGAAVDATCLSRAEMKFNAAVQKAEAKGGCVVTG